MLPGLRGLQDEAQTLEEALAAKDQELVAKEQELAAAVADKERHREELVAKDEEPPREVWRCRFLSIEVVR